CRDGRSPAWCPRRFRRRAAPGLPARRARVPIAEGMARCLRCGVDAEVGGLCREHATAIATCDGITAEQIRAQRVDRPDAWLIDQFGCPHPISPGGVIGRSLDGCALALLHPSVSLAHASIDRQGTRWFVGDRGSLNGTFVNGSRVRSHELRGGDRVAFGDASFFFTTATGPPTRPGGCSGRTFPLRSRELAFSAELVSTGGDQVLELKQRAAGGIARAAADVVELARLEFALLQALVERRADAGDPELAYVSAREIA